MQNSKKLLFNTAILTASSLLMRTIGVSFNVYLTNCIGSAGIGLFQLIVSVYSLAVTFSASGIRLACTRLVVENLETRGAGAAFITKKCLLYALATGIAGAFLLLVFSDYIAAGWLNDPQTAASFKVLAFSLPFVSMSSALNGYFTAKKSIAKYAVIQLLEQLSKICVTAAALTHYSNKGLYYSCLSIVIGMTCSEIISFALSYSLFQRSERRSNNFDTNEKGVFSLLARIAVPDAVGSVFRSVLLTIEHLLIPSGFKKSGASSEKALETYGTIHGMVLPLILYPSAIFTSLSGLLVPELAQMMVNGNMARIKNSGTRVLRITLLLSLGAAGIFFAFASSLSFAVYDNFEPAGYMQILAPLVPVMYLDMTVDGLLKGLDQQVHSMRYNIFDSALCVAMVYFIIPKYSVKGYIFILFISELINFYLSMNRLIKVSKIKIDVKNDLVVPFGCIIAAFLLSRAAIITLDFIHISAGLILGILLCLLIYLSLLFFSGALKKSDYLWFAGIALPTRRKRHHNIFSKSSSERTGTFKS